MPTDPQDHQPGLSPEQYEQLVQFLITWAGLTPQEAEERASQQAYPGQVVRRHSDHAIRRPIYPPTSRPVRLPPQ